MPGKADTSAAPGGAGCVSYLTETKQSAVKARGTVDGCVPLTKSDNPRKQQTQALLNLDVGGYAWQQACAGVSSIMADNMAKYRAGHYSGKPRFSADSAKQKFARAKDAERHAIREFSRLTTVWFSLQIPERTPTGDLRNPVAHAQAIEAAHGPVRKSLYRKVRDYQHAGVWLRAARETGYAHAHGTVWIEGLHSPETFHSVADSFVRNAAKSIDGVTVEELREANPYCEAISVNYPNQIGCTPPEDERADNETERRRGVTSALPNEIGSNLEALGTANDITDTWTEDIPSAEMRFAALIIETGARIWRPFGSFNEWAEEVGGNRDCVPLTKSDSDNTTSRSSPANPALSKSYYSDITQRATAEQCVCERNNAESISYRRR